MHPPLNFFTLKTGRYIYHLDIVFVPKFGDMLGVLWNVFLMVFSLATPFA